MQGGVLISSAVSRWQHMRADVRCLLVAVACLLVAVLLLGALSADGGGALTVLGTPKATVIGPAGRRVTCTFALRSTTDTAFRPAVLWMSCACDPCELPTEPVEPGDQFEVRCPVLIPSYGSVRLEYVVGAVGSDVGDGCRISVDARADDSPTLAVQPDECVVSPPPDGEHSLTLDFDLAYRLDLGAMPNPERDVDVHVPGMEVVGIRSQANESPDPQRFAGRITVTFKVGSTLSTAEALRGIMSTPGAPPVALTIRIGRRS